VRDAPTLRLDRVRLPGGGDPVSLLLAEGRVHAAVPAVADLPVPDAEVVDLEGRWVLPGLWDAHAHLEQWAVSRRRVDLRGAADPREAADLLAAAAREHPGDEVLVGWGFRYGTWRTEPHADLLEAVAPGRAILASSIDLHTAWCSPAALARAGVGDHPTGVLQEQACYEVVDVLGRTDPADVDVWVAEAVTAAARLGVTGIVDFEFGDVLPAWQRRAEERTVDARIVCTVYPHHLDDAIARGWPSGAPVPGTDGLVTVGPLKLFVDGSLNSRTALCHHPYPGGDDHGRLETPPDELRALLGRAGAAGIDAAVHAIGDRAVGLALDAFEATGAVGRIEHAQLVAEGDVHRLARPGLTVGVQPAHLLDDRDVTARLWPGRSHRAFPLAELLAAGVHVEFGSDAPVAPLDPWLAVSAAVTRTGDDRPAWHPEHRLTLADALAWSSRGRRGIGVGDPADLVVLDRDPSALADHELRVPGVVGTLCAGRWTFRAF
jgi:predicted amidohydrolase YtcJ